MGEPAIGPQLRTAAAPALEHLRKMPKSFLDSLLFAASHKSRWGLVTKYYVGYSHGLRYSRARSLLASSSPMTISLSPSQFRLRPSFRESMPSRLMLVERWATSMSHLE